MRARTGDSRLLQKILRLLPNYQKNSYRQAKAIIVRRVAACVSS